MKRFFTILLLTAFFALPVSAQQAPPPGAIPIQVPPFCVNDVNMAIKIFRDWQSGKPEHIVLAEIEFAANSNLSISAEVVEFTKNLVGFIYARPPQNQDELVYMVNLIIEYCIATKSPPPRVQEWRASFSLGESCG